MDSVKTIIQSLLISMGDLTHPQKIFILTLFSTLPISCPQGYRFAYGRATFISYVSAENRKTQATFCCQQKNCNYTANADYVGIINVIEARLVLLGLGGSS